MKKIQRNIFLIVGFTLLIIYSISFVTPLLWALLTSFKEEIEFMLNKFDLPKHFRIDNYITAYQTMKVTIIENGGSRDVYAGEMFKNSIIYSVIATVMHVVTPCITAYAVARYNFKFGKVIYSIVIITMILPIVGNLPSQIQVAKALGFFDSFFGLAIMKGHFLGINFMIFYAAFKSIPKDYAEAADIDGASQWQIFTKVMLPFAKTTISAVSLLSFITFWNDYTTPMVFLPSKPTIAYGLYYFNQSTTNLSNFITVRIAGSMLVSIPIFLVFILMKNRLIGNVSVGGLKG